MENPDKTWNNILAKEEQKAPLELSLLIRGAYFWKKEVRNLILLGFGQDYYARLSFTGQQYFGHAHESYGIVQSGTTIFLMALLWIICISYAMRHD